LTGPFNGKEEKKVVPARENFNFKSRRKGKTLEAENRNKSKIFARGRDFRCELSLTGKPAGEWIRRR